MNNTRRTVSGLITLSLVWALNTRSLLAQETKKEAASPDLEFEWRVSADQKKLVENNLKYQGSTQVEKDSKGLPLVAIIVGVALLPNLASAIISLRNKLVKPGIVIDARGAKIKIQTDINLPKGHILLVDKSGSKLYDTTEIKDAPELSKIISASMGK